VHELAAAAMPIQRKRIVDSARRESLAMDLPSRWWRSLIDRLILLRELFNLVFLTLFE